MRKEDLTYSLVPSRPLSNIQVKIFRVLLALKQETTQLSFQGLLPNSFPRGNKKPKIYLEMLDLALLIKYLFDRDHNKVKLSLILVTSLKIRYVLAFFFFSKGYSFICKCIVLFFLKNLCLKYAFTPDIARERSSSHFQKRKQTQFFCTV